MNKYEGEYDTYQARKSRATPDASGYLPLDINIGTCYTKGTLWTNIDPRWTWKHIDFQCIRCRVKLPGGTQVIIDRSPTGYPVGNCTLPGGGPSKYADVLLPPAHIDKVVCYRKHVLIIIWLRAN